MFTSLCNNASTPSAPWFPAKERTVEYREGLYVGYRYFETVNAPVLFPFGFGLSYTTFEYNDLTVNTKQAVFTLKNTGTQDGAEIVQLYVSAKCRGVYRPVKELKGFQKVFLKAGESKTVTIPLDDKAFRYFNCQSHRFEVEEGVYQILICSSASDVQLSSMVAVGGTGAELPKETSHLPSYVSGTITKVSDKEFARLLGRPLPDGHWSRELQTCVRTFKQHSAALFDAFRCSASSSLELFCPACFKKIFRLLGFVWDWILYIKRCSVRF